MMKRQRFNYQDLCAQCLIEEGTYTLDQRQLGIRITVPPELYQTAPFNASAYDFLQFLRPQIIDVGIIEFPGLPLNPSNYTLAQRSPKQHGYTSNPYLTDICQQLHQDTPPYPTAFWLAQQRQFSATLVTSTEGLKRFIALQQQTPTADINEIHRLFVASAISQHQALLLNQKPGLLLIDNSHHQQLYHARTSNFATVAGRDYYEDCPMYAFNEIGLLNYIDTLDERRGSEHRNLMELEAVKYFIDSEQS